MNSSTTKKCCLITAILLFHFNEIKAQSPSWTNEKISRLEEMCEANLTTTMLVYQKGEVRFSYGDDSEKYKIFSIRKSLVSLLYGIYESEDKIDINATLAELKIDDVDGLTEAEKQATVL